MSVDFVYVSKGLSRAAKSPIALRAVVGPGFVVCVRTRDEQFAGMAHVESSDLKDDSATAARIKERVLELFSEIRSLGGRLKGATADIVGGADILHIYPRHLRDRVVSTQVEGLVELLKSKEIKLGQVHAGGSVARRVELCVPGGRLGVSPVNKRERRQATKKDLEPTPPPPEFADLPEAREFSPFRELPEVSDPSLRPPELVVNMGCMEVGQSPTQLFALLGSCVGIALYDPVTKIGGLAHVMLPSARDANSERPKFADTAVPALLESIADRGGSLDRVVAKIAGGANVLRTNGRKTTPIGLSNIESVMQALMDNGIDLIWQDTGGNTARKMLVDLKTFDVSIRFIAGVPRS